MKASYSPCGQAARVLLDPDADELSRRRARVHQASCPACASSLDLFDHSVPADAQVHAPDRVLRVARVDLLREDVGVVDNGRDEGRRDDRETSAVLEQLATVRPYSGMRWRVALGLLALVQGLVSLPWVFGFNPLGSVLGRPENAHLTRDGTLGVLIAVAGIVTAWRPRHAYVMLLVSGAIIALQFSGGIVDRTDDHVALHFEAVHIVALVIALLIGVSAFRRRNSDEFH